MAELNQSPLGTFTQGAGLFTQEVYTNPILTDPSLIAYYRFNSGALTADSKDSYTLTNNNTVGEGTGKFGVGADFGASNTNKLFSISGADWGLSNGLMTFSLWVKLPSEITTGVYNFINSLDNTVRVGYYLQYEYNSGTPRLVFNRSKADVADQQLNYNVSLGTDWHHIVMTYNGVNVIGYLDGIYLGQQAASGNGSNPNANKYASIGGRDGNATNLLNGLVDDVAIFNRALNQNEITGLFVGKELTTTGLINTTCKGYWKFEETGGTTVTDSSGASHDGTASNAAILNKPGRFGNGGTFVAASSHKVSITDHADLKPTGNFSVGAWIKTSTTSGYQTIIQSFSQNANVAGFYFRLLNTTLDFTVGKNTGVTQGTDWQRVSGNINVADNNWHLVVATYDGAKIYIYVDGILDNSVSWSINSAYAATNYVRIGCANNSGSDTNFFNGSIDDVFLFNSKALTQAEINTIHSGLKAYWRMEGNSQDSAGTFNGTDTAITYSAGKFGQGAVFNGTSSFINPSSVWLSLSTVFTINVWITHNTTTAYREIITKGNTGNTHGAELRITTAGVLEYGEYDGTWSSVVSTARVDVNLPTMVTVVKNGSSITLYINGVQDGTGTFTRNPTLNNNYIGLYAQSGTNKFHFAGTMDDMAIFGRALTADEVMQLFKDQKGAWFFNQL